MPEVAAPLGVSPSLLWDEIRGGRLPVLRLGRRVLVRSTTVERLLAEGSAENVADAPGYAARRS
jgi:excisionase family DNA binding protein